MVKKKKKFLPKQFWVIHGFNKKKSIAVELLKHKFKLSIGVDLMYNNRARFEELIEIIQLTELFLETDDNAIIAMN